ncbi:hypothetical protein I3760_01G101100 [Carya illinoinensis]|nr:hypothetical protein I3760_01G101100 [Carya illinoinensis]
MGMETRGPVSSAFHSLPFPTSNADVNIESVNLCLQESPMKPRRVSTWRRRARGTNNAQNGKKKAPHWENVTRDLFSLVKDLLVHSPESKRLKTQATPARKLTHDELVVAVVQPHHQQWLTQDELVAV